MVVRKIAFAADHAGFALKAELLGEVAAQGHATLDLGTDSTESVDYPDFGRLLGEAIAAGEADCGVLVCGTGIGISIAANRVAGVRAAVCHDVTTARLARLHNDANVLAIGSRIVGGEVARDCLKTFLETGFEGGRHARRVGKLG
jgi:ribose 5-phosphate isomerase B